jgi:parallel beta-helix repeat protein
MLTGAAMVAALVSTAMSTGASATVHEVHEGESIQAAVKAAGAGDVIRVAPGVYRQSVEIRKDGIQLEGSGASEAGTVLIPPRSTSRCEGGDSGICLLGQKSSSGQRRRVADVHVSGFLVRGYEYGVLAEFARHAVFRRNTLTGNGEYGAAIFHSRRTVLIANRATRSGEAGFYIGDSRKATAVLRDNVASRNTFGYYLRDASRGEVAANVARHNCVGVMMRNSSSAWGVRRWLIEGNLLTDNSRHCGGTGIWLAGARRNVIRGNEVVGNRQEDPARFSGGIVLTSTRLLGGTPSAYNRVVGNEAHRNRRADIAWDRQGRANRFRRNDCERSDPAGLCDAG